MGGRLLGGFRKSTNLEFNCDDPRRERWQNDMPSVRISCRRRDENAKTKTKNKNKTATTNPHMGDGRVAVVGPSSARTQHRGGLPAARDFSTHGTYALGRTFLLLVRVPVRQESARVKFKIYERTYNKSKRDPFRRCVAW